MVGGWSIDNNDAAGRPPGGAGSCAGHKRES